MTLQLQVKLILITILLIAAPFVSAQEPVLDTNSQVVSPSDEYIPPKKIKDGPRPVLSAQVTETEYLPQEFYGTWQVRGVLVSTNAETVFNKTTYDIWQLQQSGDKVRLANPNSGGESIITVNEVSRNRARFTCEERIKRGLTRIEIITISVNGNQFKGTSSMSIERKKKGVIRRQEALFQIKGKKLYGPTPQVFQPNQPTPPVRNYR